MVSRQSPSLLIFVPKIYKILPFLPWSYFFNARLSPLYRFLLNMPSSQNRVAHSVSSVVAVKPCITCISKKLICRIPVGTRSCTVCARSRNRCMASPPVSSGSQKVLLDRIAVIRSELYAIARIVKSLSPTRDFESSLEVSSLNGDSSSGFDDSPVTAEAPVAEASVVPVELNSDDLSSSSAGIPPFSYFLLNADGCFVSSNNGS